MANLGPALMICQNGSVRENRLLSEGTALGYVRIAISSNFRGDLVTTSKYAVFRSHSSPYLFLETC